MRISDWSSDVCSSDLYTRRIDSKTKRPETGHLSREDGWYVCRQANDESKPARFRLSRIDENRWLMMISPPSTGEQTAPWYGLVTRHGDFYLNAHFTRANFHAFRPEMERTRPAEWAAFRRSWRDGRSAVTFSRSEEHTSELQSLMRISYAVFCLKKKKTRKQDSTEKV